MERGTWQVRPTPHGLEVWPSGCMQPEIVAWSSLERVTETSWYNGSRVERAVFLHLRRMRRAIAVYEGTRGIDELRSGVREFARTVRYEVRFSYWRSLWRVAVPTLMAANGAFHLFLGGLALRWDTVLWSTSLLFGAWSLRLLTRIREAASRVPTDSRFT
jgi:hypothetical protein